MREGADAPAKPGPVFNLAKKTYGSISGAATVGEVLRLLASGTPYLVLAEGSKWHVLDHDRFGKWTTSRADDGIVDLTEWPVSAVVAGSEPAPLIARRALVPDLLVALGFKSGTPTRYAVVTENGKAGEASLGIADLYDFIG